MKDNNDSQQAFNDAIKQLVTDCGELAKEINKRIAMIYAIPEVALGVPISEPAARIHKDFTAKIVQMLFCIYCNRPIDACTCAGAIEVEYTNITPTNVPQLPALEDRANE